MKLVRWFVALFIALICKRLSLFGKKTRRPLHGWKTIVESERTRKIYINAPKPDWVKDRVIDLKALMPQAGCRTLSQTFNRLYSEKGMTVGKTFVSTVVRNHHYEILQKRRKLKNKKPRVVPKNRVWGCDLTGKVDLKSQQHMILGVVDHFSRASLCLVPLESKHSIILLEVLLNLIKRFGKPKAIRTDNEAVFTSKLFRCVLWLLNIKHQRTRVAHPWQNGRVERFFGTLKSKLNQWNVNSFENLETSLVQFRFWYNHVRPHQNLNGKTHAEVWNGIDISGKRVKRKYGFDEWDGLLQGFYLE